MSDEKLTPKQALFVREYLLDPNGTRAAVRAGYSAATAEAAGSRLLRHVKVAAAIAAAQNAREKRTLVTADRVVTELARIAFSDPRVLYRPDGTLKPPSEWDDDVAGSVASVETDETLVMGDGDMRVTTRTHKVKRWDKLNALGKLMPHVGLKPDAPPPPPPPAGNTTHVNVNVLAADLGPYAAAIAGFLAGGREVPPDGPAEPLDTPPA